MDNNENNKINECTNDDMQVVIENACGCEIENENTKDTCEYCEYNEPEKHECICGDCSCMDDIISDNITNTEEICDCDCLINPLNVAERTCDCECPQNFNIFE